MIKFENGILHLASKSPDFELNKKLVIGKDVDVERIDARFENGVLGLQLPKASNCKTINIL
jgi:HSP20 family molecular chaperone IbpA